ncbi:MAG TPA: hypothetical protein VJM11_03675 [Nevskiaceae bacterium]|nr:hypothetical protein [Nevskiaceae bacterium]
MTDHQLANDLAAALRIEQRARAAWQRARAGPARGEAEAALVVLRRVVPLIRSLEAWLSLRGAASIDSAV